MKTHGSSPATVKCRRRGQIKCVVWDLDNTLWDGILLEGPVVIRERAVEIVKALDARGILQSIASRNDAGTVMARLQAAGLADYFLHPQINWNSKAASLRSIAAAINIGRDAIAFIDDQAFERDEVRFSLPEVLCIDAAGLDDVLDMPELTPLVVTDEARHRRSMYQSEIQRRHAEEAFVGPREEFLATLGLRLTIAPVGDGDLERAEELTVRTHQLNTTGVTYSKHELDAYRESERHKLLVASLEDRYGSYGTIGLALLECEADQWTIKLLLVSCRVMSRGIGSLMLNHLMMVGRTACVSLEAEFKPNERNRMMHVTLRLSGFTEVSKVGDLVRLRADLGRAQAAPPYVTMIIQH
jgi:FkbH-like protein